MEIGTESWPLQPPCHRTSWWKERGTVVAVMCPLRFFQPSSHVLIQGSLQPWAYLGHCTRHTALLLLLCSRLSGLPALLLECMPLRAASICFPCPQCQARVLHAGCALHISNNHRFPPGPCVSHPPVPWPCPARWLCAMAHVVFCLECFFPPLFLAQCPLPLEVHCPLEQGLSGCPGWLGCP